MTFSVKIILLGDGGVGKSTLAQRYVTGSFLPETKLTIGVEFHTKELIIDNETIILQVWDLGGEERFRFLQPTYYRGARGAILMYSIINYKSFLNLGKWMDIMEDQHCNVPVILVGAKADLTEERTVERTDAESKAHELGIPHYMEVSSKTGENVELLFETLARLIYYPNDNSMCD